MTQLNETGTKQRKGFRLRCEQLEERSVLSTMFVVDPLPPGFVDDGSGDSGDAALVDPGRSPDCQGPAEDTTDEISILPADGWDGSSEGWVDDGSWTDEGWVDDGWVDDAWSDDGSTVDYIDDSEWIFVMYVGEDGEAWCGTPDDWSSQYDYSDEMFYCTMMDGEGMGGEVLADGDWGFGWSPGSEDYIPSEDDPDVIFWACGGVPLEATPEAATPASANIAFAPDGITVEFTTPDANPSTPAATETATNTTPFVPVAPSGPENAIPTPILATGTATSMGAPRSLELTADLPLR